MFLERIFPLDLITLPTKIGGIGLPPINGVVACFLCGVVAMGEAFGAGKQLQIWVAQPWALGGIALGGHGLGAMSTVSRLNHEIKGRVAREGLSRWIWGRVVSELRTVGFSAEA